MKRLRRTTRILFCLVLFSSSSLFITSVRASHVDNSNVTVALEPDAVVGVAAGSTFSLRFNIANVVDLDGWEFTVFFAPLVLTPLASTEYVYEGFASPASDPLTVKRAITLDDEFGTVSMGATAFPLPAEGITGTGNLARIDFSVDCNDCRTTMDFGDESGLLLRSVGPAGAIDNIIPVSLGVSEFTNQATTIPIARFTYSQSPNPYLDEPTTFDASASRDPDGSIVSYNWDFGDGNTTRTPDPVIIHVYRRTGATTAVLNVTDNAGFRSAPVSKDFIVVPRLGGGNSSPLAHFNVQVSGGGDILVGENVTFDASSSNDPDGFILEFRWDFGDESPLEVLTDSFATHVFSNNGTFTVGLTVLDDDGATGSFTATVSVGPREFRSPQRPPYEIYTVIAVAVAGGVFGLVFFARRRARLKAEETEQESTI